MFSGGGMSDRFSNMRRNMMMNQDMFPSRIGGGGGDMMNSMMRKSRLLKTKRNLMQRLKIFYPRLVNKSKKAESSKATWVALPCKECLLLAAVQ
jgi:hypothetical protein